MPQTNDPPTWPGIGRLFSLGGMSECGKSHAGRYFDANGVRRIKIGRVLAEVGRDLGLDTTAPEFTERLYDEHADVALPAFVARVTEEMRREGVERASLESMYRGQLATWLKGQLGERMVNIFYRSAAGTPDRAREAQAAGLGAGVGRRRGLGQGRVEAAAGRAQPPRDRRPRHRQFGVSRGVRARTGPHIAGLPITDPLTLADQWAG